MVRPARLERATYCLEGSCSIQLSYGRIFVTLWCEQQCAILLKLIVKTIVLFNTYCKNWSGRPDLNWGPSAPKADALASCATSRKGGILSDEKGLSRILRC